jgi:hypothetical protein
MGGSRGSAGVMSACSEKAQQEAAINTIKAAVKTQWKQFEKTSGKEESEMDKTESKKYLEDTYMMMGWDKNDINNTFFDEIYTRYEEGNSSMSQSNMTSFMEVMMWGDNG